MYLSLSSPPYETSEAMWPFAHLAIGYLLYAGYTRVRFRRPPGQFGAVLVLLGSQLPDLIDKPLAWAGVLEWGRGLGHSLLFAVPLVAVVGWVLARKRREAGAPVAFGVSYAAAMISDGVHYFLQGTLAGDLREVSFWVWPLSLPAERIVEVLKLTPAIEYAIVHKAAWTAANLPAGGELKFWLRSFEVGVTVLAVAVWVHDGTPGWGLVREKAHSLHRNGDSTVGRDDE